MTSPGMRTAAPRVSCSCLNQIVSGLQTPMPKLALPSDAGPGSLVGANTGIKESGPAPGQRLMLAPESRNTTRLCLENASVPVILPNLPSSTLLFLI